MAINNSVTMKKYKLTTIALFTAISALLFAGCETKDKSESPVPWSQPADWEGQVPGMGGMGNR